MRAVIHRYEWVHLILGIGGNIAFLSGSIMMLLERQHMAVILFITGSSGMLIGGLGNLIVSLGRSHKRLLQEQAQQMPKEQRERNYVSSSDEYVESRLH